MDALNRKEAIIMGDDITPVTREEYCLKELAAGGGGSLDYVVPEQTLTLAEQPVMLGNNSLDDIDMNDNIIIKVEDSHATVCYLGLKKVEGGGEAEVAFVSEFEPSNYRVQLAKIESIWMFVITDSSNSILPGSYTVSAIRGF